jgi:hypothetical protein
MPRVDDRSSFEVVEAEVVSSLDESSGFEVFDAEIVSPDAREPTGVRVSLRFFPLGFFLCSGGRSWSSTAQLTVKGTSNF